MGIGHRLSLLVKDGNVAYCDISGVCRRVAGGYAFPNGLVLSRDGLLYVPSSVSGNAVVYKPRADGGIDEIDTIKIAYPLDNLSEDANGDLWVPGLPKLDQTLASFDDPLGAPTPPATVLRIRKKQSGGYQVDKVLEDANGEVLPGATSVVHDVRTRRIFVSGVVSPFITVCEPENK